MRHLVACAKRGDTISYGDLAGEVGGNARGMTDPLDKINKFTRNIGVLISVLVVKKQRCPKENWRPSPDFFDKWAIGDHETFFKEECRRVFQAAKEGKFDDWE